MRRIHLLFPLVGLVLATAMLSPLIANTFAEEGKLAVSTGEMLGSGYNNRWFYVSRGGGAWQPTYSGAAYREEARGKLMNFRAANAIFDDDRRSDDDPEGNTSRFISWTDDYAEHGILGYTISLQGGNPSYDGGVISAFRSDGTLKAAWLSRAARVIEAADNNGQIVILTYFYQRQDHQLADANAVRAGVRNATDWLIGKGYRNVIIEIANEFDSTLYTQSIIKTNSATGGIAELINIAKSRFDGKGYRLPVSASSRVSTPAALGGALREVADVTLPHGPLHGAYLDRDNVAALYADSGHRGPIVMNEDRQGGRDIAASETGLKNERLTATLVFNAKGSWGMSWQSYNQVFPFKWAIGGGTDISGDNKANYFHAVLDHIRSLTFATPHDGAGVTPPVSSNPPSGSASASEQTPTPSESGSASEQPPAPTESAPPTGSVPPTESVAPTESVPPTGSVPPSEAPPSEQPSSSESPPPAPPVVASFTLINAETDQPIAGFDPVPEGALISKAQVGTGLLSLRANVTPAVVGSVRWGLNAQDAYRTEKTIPYAFAGDASGNFAPWRLVVGAHTVTATAFTGTALSGTQSEPLSLNFTLTN